MANPIAIAMGGMNGMTLAKKLKDIYGGTNIIFVTGYSEYAVDSYSIQANSAIIAGAIKGDIDVQGLVILDASAIVMGNVKSKSVQINNGAVIEGMCSQCYAEVNPTSFFDKFKKTKRAAMDI